MSGKPLPPYFVFDPTRLDRKFYDGYDERFLHRKITVLGAFLDNPELLEQFVISDDGADAIERFKHSLAAEIYFSEFHQFECFFAMLMAPFQELPHWIYLSTYSTASIKQKLHLFLDERFEALSNNLIRERNEFLRHAIYAGVTDSQPNHESWTDTFENLWWVIHRMAKKFLDATEYNSYKHGLRVISASSSFAICPEPSFASRPEQLDLSKATVFGSSNSISHLFFEKRKDGTQVSIETKGFNPNESRANIQIMVGILANIKRIRLAILGGKTGVEITKFPSVDKEALCALAVHCQIRFPA